MPATLTFVPTDFETLSLDLALEQAGFHRDKPAFFSWLGVTVYLDAAAIRNTLEYIADLAPGSAVVFDYGVVPNLLSPRERKAMEILSKTVAEQGEPWKSFFEPEALTGLLHSLGFQDIEDFGPELLNDRYLTGRTDGLRKSGVFRLVFAGV
jgi:methyltransferase (TIGR00027 family)